MGKPGGEGERRRWCERGVVGVDKKSNLWVPWLVVGIDDEI